MVSGVPGTLFLTPLIEPGATPWEQFPFGIKWVVHAKRPFGFEPQNDCGLMFCGRIAAQSPNG